MVRVYLAVCAVILLNISLITSVQSARILGFFISPSKSHLFINCAIADTLAEAGHNVTVLATFPNVYKNAKYNYIEVKQREEVLNQIAELAKSAEQSVFGFWKIAQYATNQTLLNPRIQQFLSENGEGSFDLILIGYFFNDFQLGVAGHFKCPLIVTWQIRPIFELDKLVGNPTESSYVPTIVTAVRQPMTFLQRVENALYSFAGTVFFQGLRYLEQEFYNEHFPSDRYPSLDEVRANVSLIFVNHHSLSQGPIKPQVPATIEIGGIQVKDKPNPLPKDLSDIFNNSKKGVIYLSFGGNVKPSVLSEERVKTLFNAFSKLPYTFLWKWSDADPPGSSPNIFFKTWLPQDDILAHPNLKLFITHGGQGSVVESQYRGVPMIVFPFFGDQFMNAKSVVDSGFGIQLDFSTITEDTLRNTILEVLNNPIYKNKIQKFSDIYRDRPLKPREEVLYWTEYVLRHQGAKHIQSPAVHMYNFQVENLDVLVFILAVFGVIIFIVISFFKCLCGRSKKQTHTKKLKNN